MRIIDYKSFEQFHQLVMEVSQHSALFRGAGDFERDRLQPKIGWLQMGGRDRRAEELEMFQLFKREAVLLAQTRPADDFEWLGLAQHHGLPTRLLDWTENPLVALFFAVRHSGDSDPAVFVFADPEETSNDEYKNPFEITQVRRIDVPQLTPRLGAQSATFTIHPNYETPYDSNSITKIRINRQLKPEILHMLYRYGVHAGSLFPGLDSLAEHIIYRRTR